MVLEQPKRALELRELPQPKPRPNQILVKVLTCAVCRTDLHIFDGELTSPKLPLVLGHEIVGRIEQLRPEGKNFAMVNSKARLFWLLTKSAQCADRKLSAGRFACPG